MFSSKAYLASLLPWLCFISAFPAMWWHTQCKQKLCTQKYCMGSLKLRPRGWMWLCILMFYLLVLSAAANKMCRPRTSVSLCPHRSVSAPMVPPFLMQTHQSWRRGRSKIMFDKHSSQEASHSDFTTSGTWSNGGPSQSRTPDWNFQHTFSNSLGISVYTWVCVCVVLVVVAVAVGGRCICEYKTVILSMHSQAINSTITNQRGCCVWLHNHRSKSHSHSAPSYERGYCFNPFLFSCERGYGGFVPSWLIQLSMFEIVRV